MRMWHRRRASPREPSPSGAQTADRTDRTRRPGRRRGLATVEFAVSAVAFLLMVFGTIDFGRSIFLYSELHHAVRDAAREAKVRTANGNVGGAISQSLIQNRVRRALNPETGSESDRPGLTSATVTYSCAGGCASGNRLTIQASIPFITFTQDFLGIGPITLRATTSVTLE